MGMGLLVFTARLRGRAFVFNGFGVRWGFRFSPKYKPPVLLPRPRHLADILHLGLTVGFSVGVQDVVKPNRWLGLVGLLP